MKSGQIKVDSTNSSQWVIRVSGVFDLDAFEHRCLQLMRRHDAMRASAVELEGQPYLVFDPAPAWSLQRVDLAGTPETLREAEARATVRDLVWCPLNIVKGPAFKAFAIVLGPGEYIIGVLLHHFVSDGMSMLILRREVDDLVSGGEAATLLGEPCVQYSEYLASMDEWLASPAAATHLDYWRQRLTGAAPITPPKISHSHAAPRIDVNIDAQLSSAIHSTSFAMKTTAFVFLLAAQYALLARLTGLKDITVGAVILGRELPPLQSVVGYLSDRAYYRVDLAGDPSFAEIIHRARACIVEVAAHQFVRSDVVKGLMHDKRVVAPIFNYRPAGAGGSASVPRNVVPYAVGPPPAQSGACPEMAYWLTLIGAPHGIRGQFRFGSGAIEGLLPGFVSVLAQAVACPQRRLSSFNLPAGVCAAYSKSAQS